jgi:dihydrofolate reductase
MDFATRSYLSGKRSNRTRRETDMGTIVISENVSLDGVVQDPTGEEGFRHGGWFGQFGGKDLEEWGRAAFQEALRAEALLFGRRSYEYFAARWPSRPGEWADRLRSLPKYVVSSTPLEAPGWQGSRLIGGDVVSEISKLKQELDGEIVVYASRQLVRMLLSHELVDELRLTIYPVVLGAGDRLFDEIGEKTPLRLLNASTIGEDLAFVTYEVLRE